MKWRHYSRVGPNENGRTGTEMSAWRLRGNDADVGWLLLWKRVNTVKNIVRAREMTSPPGHSCDRGTEREREREEEEGRECLPD